MKKIFTLMAAALLAVNVNAQTETPLVLGGGWNAGFAGEDLEQLFMDVIRRNGKEGY